MYEQIPIRHRGKIVGHVVPDIDSYVTDRTQYFHKHRRIGHAISRGVFEQLDKNKIKTIRIRFFNLDGTMAIQIVHYERWRDSDVIHFFGLDEQKFLALEDFDFNSEEKRR